MDLQDSMCKLAGIANTTGDAARERWDAFALKELGLTSLDAAFQRVDAAAKDVGLGDQFSAWNKHLSKFAHPTAGRVIGVMHQDDIRSHIQSACTTMGLYYRTREDYVRNFKALRNPSRCIRFPRQCGRGERAQLFV